jgi:hypothetical protein
MRVAPGGIVSVYVPLASASAVPSVAPVASNAVMAGPPSATCVLSKSV